MKRTIKKRENAKLANEIAGRVLIPGCMAAAVSGDIEQCTCRDFDLSFSQFERKRYNDELKRRNDEIKNLQEDNKYLMQELERHVEMLAEYAAEREKALEAKHKPNNIIKINLSHKK